MARQLADEEAEDGDERERQLGATGRQGRGSVEGAEDQGQQLDGKLHAAKKFEVLQIQVRLLHSRAPRQLHMPRAPEQSGGGHARRAQAGAVRGASPAPAYWPWRRACSQTARPDVA